MLLATFVVQALATGCMLAGVDYLAEDVLDQSGATDDPVRLLRRTRPAADARVGGAGRADRQAHRLLPGVAASWPLGALASVTGAVGAAGVVFAAVAVVGVGYAGCQVFPLAMLPDAAAADARRTGSSRVGIYTGVWTAGETLGLALGPGLFALVLALGGYVSSTDRRRRPVGHGPHRDHARLLRAPGGAGRCSACWSLSRYRLDAREVALADRRPLMDDVLARAAGAAGRGPAGARRAHAGLRLRLRACPTSTGSGARRWRRTPARTASTRRRSRACWRWRTTSSASPATCSTRRTPRSGR